ncbi:MAG TPA: acetylglutamate kinase [Dehalococcoidia bacterium]|nr:acetylglutamate kinase [Dehalococcoidia bacterium]
MSQKTIVVKIGGSTLGSHDTAMEDIVALWQAGRRMVLVHGGGSAATDWLKIHGVTSEFVDGLRVTGADAIDVVVAVFAGLVNKQIVADLRALGAPAFGLSGVDGGVLKTKQADPRLGFVGEVTVVDTGPIEALLDAGYLPVLSPVGFWDVEPQRLMNVNADTVAGEVAAALAAEQLVFLTDVAHVRGGDGAAIDQLHPADVSTLIATGVASGGMIPKLKAGARAASAGVSCSIVDGREARALRAVLEGAALGTRVRA